jgi:uncharacterized protein
MSQNQRLKAFCNVNFAGLDITDKLEPFLVSIAIVDEKYTECHLELDDRNGMLPIPGLLAPITASLGWNGEEMKRTFEGMVMGIEYGFDRKQGGRRMFVHANGVNMFSKVKEPQDRHWGDESDKEPKIPLRTVLSDAAKGGGVTLAYLSPQLEVKKYAYKAQQHESFLQFGESIAHELRGAIFGIKKVDKAYMRHPHDPTGKAMVTWGDNLIEMRIYPFSAKSSWSGGQQSHYDSSLASWVNKKQKSGGQGAPGQAASATNSPPGPAANAGEAEQQIGGMEDENYPGNGHIVVNGEPSFEAYQDLTISGVRPGVDGDYIILRVEHKWSRQGYTTALEVLPNTSSRSAPGKSSAYTVHQLPDTTPPDETVSGAGGTPNVGSSTPGADTIDRSGETGDTTGNVGG